MTDTLWTLLLVQIALGAFDTLYHHEGTERLAWRQSQRAELRLHGVRNLFYAVLFAGLGTVRPEGLLAVLVMVLLAGELIITLIDFVEEDRSRRLPPSERITHTLLALNYGAILALFLPPLWQWAARGSGLVPVDHGVFTPILVAAACGVAFFGLRDLAASARLGRIAAQAHGPLLTPEAAPRDILVTGGTGFVGARLVEALAEAGDRVIVLTRNRAKAAHLPARIVTSLDEIPATQRLDAVVSLAGKSVAGGLWTRRRRRAIVTSRLRTAHSIGALIDRLDVPPGVVVAASAIGIYGVSGRLPVTEAEPFRRDGSFLARAGEAKERGYARLSRRGTRLVCLRIGLVLGTEGGLLARLLLPFDFGLGAVFGDGRQWMSWIGRDDLVRLIDHVLKEPSLEGPVNAVAPNPVRNAAFARTLALALHRPCAFRLPTPLLRLAGGLGRELFLSGRCVLPAKALASGFVFRDPALAPLLRRLVGSEAPGGAERPYTPGEPARPALALAALTPAATPLMMRE